MTPEPTLLAGPVSTLRWHRDGAELRADETFSAGRERWDRANGGTPVGLKVALHGHATDGRGGLELTLATTDWREVSIVHDQLEADAEMAAVESARVLETGRWELPNILSIHAVVRCTDGSVVATRRATTVRYHPGRWSVSFEEGLEIDDLDSPDPLATCVARGLMEELAIDRRHVRQVTPTGLALEPGIVNPALLALAVVDLSGAELLALASAAPDEVDDVRILGRGDLPADAHPTSALRLSLLT